MRDEAAFKARAGAALSVREKLLEVVKKLTTEVEATIARCGVLNHCRCSSHWPSITVMDGLWTVYFDLDMPAR